MTKRAKPLVSVSPYLLDCFWWRSERRSPDGWYLLSGLGTGVVSRYKHQPATPWHLWTFLKRMIYGYLRLFYHIISTAGISSIGTFCGYTCVFPAAFPNPTKRSSMASRRSCKFSYIFYRFSSLPGLGRSGLPWNIVAHSVTECNSMCRSMCCR